MPLTRRIRRILLFFTLYLAFCLVAGIYVAAGTMHPARRALTPEDETTMREISRQTLILSPLPFCISCVPPVQNRFSLRQKFFF
jgi:hypothetical protein